MPVRTNSKSGWIGVWWDPSRKSWRATIRTEGRVIYLGTFKAREDAIAARARAEVKYLRPLSGA